MDLFEALEARRSIRSYTADPVSDEAVEEILGAGLISPSANNQQPWTFVVVRDPATRVELARLVMEAHAILFSKGRKASPMTAEEAKERAEKVFATYGDAPAWIVAFRVPRDWMNEEYKSQERDADLESISAAFYGMLLAARALGLATVWTHTVVFLERELKDPLGAPEEAEFIALTPVGYPQSWPDKASARRPAEEVVVRERF